jgi:hypothetical protein
MVWIREQIHKVLQITHGRSTAFFILFFITGNVMAIKHLLTPVYVGYMGTLGGLILGHSVKEDWAEKMNGPRPDGGPDLPPPGGPKC